MCCLSWEYRTTEGCGLPAHPLISTQVLGRPAQLVQGSQAEPGGSLNQVVVLTGLYWFPSDQVRSCHEYLVVDDEVAFFLGDLVCWAQL